MDIVHMLTKKNKYVILILGEFMIDVFKCTIHFFIIFIGLIITPASFMLGLMDANIPYKGCFHPARGQFLVPAYNLGCYLGEKK